MVSIGEQATVEDGVEKGECYLWIESIRSTEASSHPGEYQSLVSSFDYARSPFLLKFVDINLWISLSCEVLHSLIFLLPDYDVDDLSLSKGPINQSGYEAAVRNGEMKLCVLVVGAVGYKEASGAGQDEVAAAGCGAEKMITGGQQNEWKLSPVELVKVCENHP
ncbi:hypothetical protein C5167_010295 [Papaver somniferum]|uniref:Uncharacterized protein n=1 Tax=Papaver somniferum TaxID=3469 RepID=A0A4Y7K3T1_PAPSO|nr:hypothetical protein C5167_010295 [Papaver somniferum]